MVIIRNRIIPLLLRIAIFSSLVAIGIFYWSELPYAYTPYCLFEVQAGTAYTVAMGLVVVFNAIDLRHGIRGVPASGYMPVLLCLTGCAVIGGLLGLTYMLPMYGFSSPFAITYYSLLIALPLLDWILCEEKGTVRYHEAWAWMTYPVLFFVFTLLRPVIWPNSPLFGNVMYQLAFLNPKDPLFFVYALGAFAVIVASFLFLIYMNNMLGGKYKRKFNPLED